MTTQPPKDADLPPEVFFRVTFAPSDVPRHMRLKRFLKAMGRAWGLRCRAFVDEEQLPHNLVEIVPEE
jgi:hypothetical protein